MGFIEANWVEEKNWWYSRGGLWFEVYGLGSVWEGCWERGDNTEKESDNSSEGERGEVKGVVVLKLEGLLEVDGGAVKVLFGAVKTLCWFIRKWEGPIYFL